MITLIWKVTAVLLIGRVLEFLLRKSAASIRSLVWLATICVALALPVASLVVPAWEISAAATPIAIITSAARAQGNAGIRAISFLWLWAAGSILILARIAVSHVAARRISTAPTPLVVGLVKPRIILPAESQTWSAARLGAVIGHEQAHIDRLDNLRQLAANLMCALYWFHPLAWMAARRMKTSNEQACDDAVLRGGAAPSAYAGYLLDLAIDQRFSAALAIAERTAIGARIEAILDRTRGRRALTRGVAAATAITVAALLVPMAALKADDEVYKIGGDVSRPNLIEKSEPSYPPEAREAKVEGSVTLEITIGKDGSVRDIELIRGLRDDMDAAAIGSVSTWRFEPARKAGKPVACRARVEVNFRLL